MGPVFGIACATVDLGRDEPDGSVWAQPPKVFGGCGGAVADRRTMLQDIGFLDPDFFMIYEDVDLSFRAQLCGYECVYIPSAIVHHRYRVTLGKAPSRQAFYSQRNIEFVHLKNMPLGLILRSASQRLAYEVDAAVYLARQGAASTFLPAKLEVLKCLPSILRKRKEIQEKKTTTNLQMRAIMRKSLFSNKWKKLRAVWTQPAQGSR
jgi:GT2 family glycosyltransferase